VFNPEPNATVTLSPLLSFEFLSSARTARRPESRTNKKHRTELAPLLVQEFGRDRNSRSSRLATPRDFGQRSEQSGSSRGDRPSNNLREA
jgi:hypothetical protein